MNTSRDLELPSGFEVESARLNPPVTQVSGPGSGLPERSGVRGRLDAWKSRGLSKVHDIQRMVSERSTAARGSLVDATHSVRDGAKLKLHEVQSSMRSNPMKWAGIAAGAGFGIGLLGRVARWRSAHRRVMPDLVIIESSC